MKQLLLLLLPFACLGQSHDPAPYCLDAVSNHYEGTLVTNVTFNTLNYTAYPVPIYVPQGNHLQPWWGYEYFDTLAPTVVHTDSSYLLSLSFDYSATLAYPCKYYSAWIDYNGNHVFDDNEVVMSNATASFLPNSATTRTAVITIPHGAQVGVTRMRVTRRDQYTDFVSGTQVDPCPSYYTKSEGNTQDYDIVITDTVPPIDTTTSIKSVYLQQQQVYPNPSTGVFRIGNETIDLSAYPSGLYIRRVGNKYYKLMKH